MKCEALQKLIEWQNGERGRRTEIYQETSYAPHEWSVTLTNVDREVPENWVYESKVPLACVIGLDMNIENPQYKNAENVVLVEEDELEKLIFLTIEKAEELGL